MTTAASPTSPLDLLRRGWHLGAFDPTTPLVAAGAFIATGPSLAMPYMMSALRFPTRRAITDDTGSLTYAQLAIRIERLAAALRSAGIGPDDRVGLLCRNHRGFVELNAACGRIGAVPVYLNTGFGAEQLRQVATREQVVVVFHDDEFSALVNDAGWSSYVVAPEDDPTWSVPDLSPPIVGINRRLRSMPSAGILMTSGTTGTPKGARRDSGADPAAVGAVFALPRRRGARSYIAAPLFHAWGLSQLAFAAALGQSVRVRRTFDPERTIADLGHHRAEELFAVPVMLQRILDVLPNGDSFIAGNLRLTATSGSALSGTLATRWMDAYGDTLYNFYGSTEVGHVAVATPADLRLAPGCAGRPPIGAHIRLLDDAGRDVVDGATGRIVVRNGAHFDGYTGGETKRVVDGYMETGDIGHLDAHGLLHVTGRADDMIISGGENLFPGEIEDFLLAQPGVVDAAAVGIDDAEFGQVVGAVVVARRGASVDVTALRDAVKTSLATFKAPKRLVVVEEIPRNTTGKIRRDQVRGILDDAARAAGG